jgi:MFS family permease
VRSGAQQHLSALSFGLASVLAGATLAVLGATAPSLRADLGVTPALLTVAYGSQTVGLLVGAVLAGALRDRAPTIRSVALATATALSVAAAAPSLGVLTAALGVVGAGCYALNAAAQAAMMSALDAGRAVALSRFHLLGGAGAVLFPLLVAAALAASISWRAAFLAVALGYLVLARSRARLFVRTPQPATARARLTPAAKWAGVLIACAIGVQLTIPLHLASLVVERFDESPAVGSLAVGLFWAGLLAARVVGTLVIGRTGAQRQLRISCGLLLAGYLSFAVAGDVAGLIGAAVLIGAGLGQLFPLGAARAADEIGDDAYSSSLTFVLSAGAQLIVPVAIAALLAYVSLQTALLWTFLVAALVPLAVRRSDGDR